MSEKIFEIGSYVMYKNDGVCLVSDIRFEDFSGNGQREYYVLEPVGSRSSHTYLPVDMPPDTVSARATLTRREIDSAIDESFESDIEWVDNSKLRGQLFKQILAEGNTVLLLRLCRLLSDVKEKCETKHKKMYISDLRVLESAEKTILNEFSFVLGLDRFDVPGYIAARVNNK